MTNRSLDCTGLSCPMPIVEISKAIRGMEPGDVLEVTASDLAFQLDVEAWSRRTGHLIENYQADDVQKVWIRVNG